MLPRILSPFLLYLFSYQRAIWINLKISMGYILCEPPGEFVLASGSHNHHRNKKPILTPGCAEKDALGRFLPQDQDGYGCGLNKQKASFTSAQIKYFISQRKSQELFSKPITPFKTKNFRGYPSPIHRSLR